ncbi:MAG: hypothetical protein ACI9A7_000204 [Cyclobacteriaceae bacterium]|jgi:hypothetical protein
MSAFKEIYDKIFGNKTGNFNHQEVLIRSEQFSNDYSHWKKSFQRIDLVQEIRDSRELKLRKIIGEPDVHILSTPTSSGFAISCKDQIESSEAQFLLEWFKDQMLGLQYKKANADKSMIEREEYVELIEKYYLKPIILGDAPYNQQYGNVLLELTYINDSPSYLKVLANNYIDRSYQKAFSFNKLAEYLLESKKT